jgi:hypothetical protein
MINGLFGAINIMNDFNTDLAYANNSADNYLIDSFYKTKFPGLKEIQFVEDLEMQKLGIDKILHFENGKQVTIDEKKRRVDYGDILLELWKNKEMKKPGWLFTCQCDYVSYIVMPTSKIYLLPTLLLTCVWATNSKYWLEKYEQKYSKNKGYTTVNIAIPTDILLEAIAGQMRQDIYNS